MKATDDPDLSGSNRYRLVDRERLFGTIDGVDFGGNLSCLARSPTAVLLWDGGHRYFSGIGNRGYGEASLIALPHRRPDWGRHPEWKRIGPGGGRLSRRRVLDHADELRGIFDDPGLIEPLVAAVRDRQTLLIEGGGKALTCRA